MQSEEEVQQKIRLEAARYGIILWRNNNGALDDETGRPVRYGLGNDSKKISETFKSADLIGVIPIEITSQMVGQFLGVFLAVEVKKEGWKFNDQDKREVAQQNFLNFVSNKFGVSGFCNSVESFLKLIKK